MCAQLGRIRALVFLAEAPVSQPNVKAPLGRTRHSQSSTGAPFAVPVFAISRINDPYVCHVRLTPAPGALSLEVRGRRQGIAKLCVLKAESTTVGGAEPAA